MSASFGQLTPSASVSLFSGSKKSIAADFSTSEKRSHVSGVALPNFKMTNTSGGNYAQSSNPGFPSAVIMQVDVQNMNTSSTLSRTSNGTNHGRNLTSSYTIGGAAESAMSAQQGSKRATPALAAKTASVTANPSKSAAKKVGSDPGDPGAGGSLPVGDGMWILLLFAFVYGVGADAKPLVDKM